MGAVRESREGAGEEEEDEDEDEEDLSPEKSVSGRSTGAIPPKSKSLGSVAAVVGLARLVLPYE